MPRSQCWEGAWTRSASTCALTDGARSSDAFASERLVEKNAASVASERLAIEAASFPAVSANAVVGRDPLCSGASPPPRGRGARRGGGRPGREPVQSVGLILEAMDLGHLMAPVPPERLEAHVPHPRGQGLGGGKTTGGP